LRRFIVLTLDASATSVSGYPQFSCGYPGYTVWGGLVIVEGSGLGTSLPNKACIFLPVTGGHRPAVQRIHLI